MRDHLRTRLPRYMIPATISVLSAMPLSHNGKLDRAALPDPAEAATADGDVPAARPATVRERAVAEVFRDVLGVAEVEATVSFFDLGGTSFDAVRAIRRIEGASVALLGAHPSVRELAAALDGPAPAEDRRLVRLTGARPAERTLACVPYGGGSAITYRGLAEALPQDVALLALAVPGHELGADDEPRPVEEVARDAAEAVAKVVDGPVAVYGHCAGVALAVELARCLEESRAGLRHARLPPRRFAGRKVLLRALALRRDRSAGRTDHVPVRERRPGDAQARTAVPVVGAVRRRCGGGVRRGRRALLPPGEARRRRRDHHSGTARGRSHLVPDGSQEMLDASCQLLGGGGVVRRQ